MRRTPRCEIAGECAGFTILEVLVAIAVVTIVLGSIGMVVASTTRGVRSLEQHVILAETARSVAASLRSRQPLATNELSGELFGNRWQIGVSPMSDGTITPMAQSPWIPQIVKFRVRSPSGGTFDVETVRLQQRKSQSQ